jgi:hypothetical protein
MPCGYFCREVIRDQLIPNAVSWYTGEAGEEEEDDEDEVAFSIVSLTAFMMATLPNSP